MEHLRDHYGSFETTIQCAISMNENCCVGSEDDFFGHKHGYDDFLNSFLNFPARHGWTVDPSTYHLQLAKTQSSDGGFIPKKGEEFIQSWLFFCLITCIVRTDKPLLKFKDLTTKPGKQYRTVIRYLHTQELKTALAQWHQWAKENPQESRLRLIQSDLVLELGRQVVRANLAEGAERTTDLGVSLETSLAIMLLGELLSAAKLEIMESTGAKVRGWHEDDNEGWGNSELVSILMTKANFCPHVAKMLKVQMGSNATLLLAATKHYPGDKNHGKACEDADNCIYISASTTTTPASVSHGVSISSLYRPQHHVFKYGQLDEACKKDECPMVGPDMDQVYDILGRVDPNDEGSEFPLFRIQRPSTGLVVEVVPWSRAGRRLGFATISHVWSQGLGNEDKNEVHRCQLDHIAHLLESLEPQSGTGGMDAGHLFWLDTFAIPVRPKDMDLPSRFRSLKEFSNLKRLSIRQIRHVFDSSTHSVVIDKDLSTHETGTGVMEVSMRLLTSSWMRRLWTLQEAFLSRELSIVSRTHQPRPHKGDQFPGWDFETLMEALATERDDVQDGILSLSMSGILSRQLRENLMVSERNERNRPGNPVGTKGSTLIASAWRSVRWRSTSRQEDETLALATLLNLDYRDTEISKAGGVRKFEPGAPEARKHRQQMMKQFWQLIHQHWEGSIPSGMIFLPPPRLSISGFGWSPETWMTGKVEDYPYPLARMDYPTDLKPEGLLVRYPGVILYSSDFASKLTDKGPVAFDFPIDRELNEWYFVTAIEKPSGEVQNSITDAGNRKASKRFSLILSRPRPKDRNEVALLVEIYASPWRRKEGEAPHEVYHCRIITRVWIRRMRPQKLSSFGVIGELTDENQHWCVDDYDSYVKIMQDELKSNMDNTGTNDATRGNQSEEVPSGASWMETLRKGRAVTFDTILRRK